MAHPGEQPAGAEHEPKPELFVACEAKFAEAYNLHLQDESRDYIRPHGTPLAGEIMDLLKVDGHLLQLIRPTVELEEMMKPAFVLQDEEPVITPDGASTTVVTRQFAVAETRIGEIFQIDEHAMFRPLKPGETQDLLESVRTANFKH
jgi:hypothetical protein